MERVLALDYGSHRTGLALSDPTGQIAYPLDFLNMKESDPIKRIGELVQKESCTVLLIGLPLSLEERKETQKSLEVRDFAENLEKQLGIPVLFWDERLSTDEALRILRFSNASQKTIRKKKDSLTAQILLQEYLNSKTIQD